MGRGDVKTKKGKISKGSYGVLRPHKKKKTVVAKPKNKKVVAKKAATEKPAVKKSPAKKQEE